MSGGRDIGEWWEGHWCVVGGTLASGERDIGECGGRSIVSGRHWRVWWWEGHWWCVHVYVRGSNDWFMILLLDTRQWGVVKNAAGY